ncbi:phage portal protein [Virgibacillus sp. CBA3643]|uniref:phage portal protein n=1 Tax=Virgibacillus sp. CBA3643 TaxID=2942278 RepID=UPI0035A30803
MKNYIMNNLPENGRFQDTNANFQSERHTLYKEYKDMYDNFEEYYIKMGRLNQFSWEHPYLPLALPKEISNLYSDLAFGNPINATTKSNKQADAAIDDIIEDNELNVQLSEASISQSYKGGIVAKNYLDNGISKITFIEPDYYFPVTSPTDKRKVLYEDIAIPFIQGNKQYLHTERYLQDGDGYYRCITQIYDYANDKKGKAITEPEEVNTKLTQSPLTYIPFSRSGTNFWGDSLYRGLTPLFDELNHRTTQVSNVLDIHADPAMWAVSSVFDDDGNLKRKGNKVYEVDEDSEGSVKEPMGYITWDGQLSANFKFIEDIIYKTLHYVSPLAPALYGMDSASQASGRAIQLKSWRTQCKITRSYQYWRTALKKVLYVAQQLQIISGEKSYTPEIPQIELSINMPVDLLENAQAEQLKVEAGLTSKKSSIARLNPHMTTKEVEEEWLEIINEQNENNQQTFMTDMTGFGSPLDDNSNTDDTTNNGDTNGDN